MHKLYESQLFLVHDRGTWNVDRNSSFNMIFRSLIVYRLFRSKNAKTPAVAWFFTASLGLLLLSLLCTPSRPALNFYIHDLTVQGGIAASPYTFFKRSWIFLAKIFSVVRKRMTKRCLQTPDAQRRGNSILEVT